MKILLEHVFNLMHSHHVVITGTLFSIYTNVAHKRAIYLKVIDLLTYPEAIQHYYELWHYIINTICFKSRISQDMVY